MLTIQESEIALGCRIYLTVVSDADEGMVKKYLRKLWVALFEFEMRCSRFLPASELSQFNKAAGMKQPITPEFRDVLLAAQRMSKVSEGLYNPFVLPALQRAGYVKSMVAKYSEDPVDDFSKRSIASPDKLEIGDTWASIPYGTAIDLGGCGKGYAGDMLADMVDEFPEIHAYWFSLGGDIVARGLDEHGNPWPVHIEAAADPGSVIGTITLPGLERYAIATSGPVRSAPKLGRAYVHIIDPRTERPVKADIAQSSVCAQSALLADVLASCVIIAGKAHARTYLEKESVIGGLLQTESKKIIKLGDIHFAKKVR